METGPVPPKGLHVHDIGWYLDFVSKNRFNAIRIPLNVADVRNNTIVDFRNSRAAEPELRFSGIRYLDLLHELAQRAAERNLLIMPVFNRIERKATTVEDGGGLWYTGTTTEEDVTRAWEKVAEVLCPDWNVFAFDLFDDLVGCPPTPPLAHPPHPYP